MAKKQDEELATEDNVKPLIEKAFQTLLSGHKKILLEALDKLEKKKKSRDPEVMEIYRIALNDVRKIIS